MDYTMSHQHTPAHLINSAQFHRWLHRLHRQKALLRVLFFVITFAYWELMHNRMPPKNEYDSIMGYP